MYRQYWGMQSHPFTCKPCARLHVPLAWSELARAKLAYVLSSGLGAAAITGMAGVGKSELARLVQKDLERAGWQCASARSGWSIDGIISALGSCLDVDLDGRPSPGPRRTDLLASMTAAIAARSRAGANICIVLDDAHLAGDPRILEWARLVLAPAADGARTTSILLVGQPEMEKRLRCASGLDTHLAMCIRAVPLSREDTKRYMLFRLKAAGCSRGIFTQQAAGLVHDLSQGIARNINRLGELALVTGYGLGVKKIGPDIIITAASELGLAPEPEEAQSFVPAEEEDILAGLG